MLYQNYGYHTKSLIMLQLSSDQILVYFYYYFSSNPNSTLPYRQNCPLFQRCNSNTQQHRANQEAYASSTATASTVPRIAAVTIAFPSPRR